METRIPPAQHDRLDLISLHFMVLANLTQGEEEPGNVYRSIYSRSSAYEPNYDCTFSLGGIGSMRVICLQICRSAIPCTYIYNDLSHLIFSYLEILQVECSWNYVIQVYRVHSIDSFFESLSSLFSVIMLHDKRLPDKKLHLLNYIARKERIIARSIWAHVEFN